MALLTNNDLYAELPQHPHLQAVLIQGTAFDVIQAARDKIHTGWRLVHHPLYGNVRPRLQPFRTLLLQHPQGADTSLDMFSLRLIDSAIAVYESEKDVLACPDSVPLSLRQDCAYLDAELMRETLSQSGIASPTLSDWQIEARS